LWQHAHPGGPEKRAVKRLWWCGGTSQEIGWEEHLGNDLYFVEWDVNTLTLSVNQSGVE